MEIKKGDKIVYHVPTGYGKHPTFTIGNVYIADEISERLDIIAVKDDEGTDWGVTPEFFWKLPKIGDEILYDTRFYIIENIKDNDDGSKRFISKHFSFNTKDKKYFAINYLDASKTFENAPESTPDCTCTLSSLMVSGCSCGAIQRFNAHKLLKERFGG